MLERNNEKCLGFEKRVIELMTENNIPIRKLADETGIKESTINKWRGNINANSKPSSENLYILSNYFNVTMEWLLTGNGKKSPYSIGINEEFLLNVYELLSESQKAEIIRTCFSWLKQ